MTLGIRKLIVLVLAASLFLLANLVLAANWLQEKGVVDWAKCERQSESAAEGGARVQRPAAIYPARCGVSTS
jgi:hypothetical protein